ncbi:unnamed protein product [Phaedon cochleariae]|uniref:Uncharacterized protein n=1 Tax=Phaedon cochleariae TaxID=80249 RepID=A0A9N9X2S4_PHACE|nr:unnamed protein product [Phaedon cochleariae]
MSDDILECARWVVQVSDLRQGLQAEIHPAPARADPHRQPAVWVSRVRQEVPAAEPPDAAPAHPRQREAVRMRVLRAHLQAARHLEPAPAHPFGSKALEIHSKHLGPYKTKVDDGRSKTKRILEKLIEPSCTTEKVAMRMYVSPHLVFKNGINPTLWPQDVPFPPDEGKEEVQSTYGDNDADRAACFSPNGLAGNLQYPAYFKDPKGMNHAVFGAATQFGALQYLKQQQQPEHRGNHIDDLLEATSCPVHSFADDSTLHTAFSFRAPIPGRQIRNERGRNVDNINMDLASRMGIQ